MLTVAVHFCLRNTTGTHPLQPLQLQKEESKTRSAPLHSPGHIKILGRFFYKRNANELFLTVICRLILFIP